MGVHITANCLQQWPPKTCQRNASLLPMASSPPSSTSCSSVSSLRMATPVWRFARPLRRHEIIIRATRTQNVLGEKGRRIRELTAVVQKRFNFPPGSVELYAEKVLNRGLCSVAQAESLRYKLLGGLAVRRACYG